MHLCDVWACRSNMCELEKRIMDPVVSNMVKAQVRKTHRVPIHPFECSRHTVESAGEPSTLQMDRQNPNCRRSE